MMPRYPERKLRLLFDELLPWRVASALRELRYKNISYVGDEHSDPPAPARGSSDEVVLDHAIRVNQIVVTSNHDMIVLCAERGCNIIWIDPRGRQIEFEEMVLLCFKHITDWAERFDAAAESVCLRALRTKTETLTLDETLRRVHNRMRKRSSTQPTKKKPPPRPVGGLLTHDESDLPA